MTRNWILGALVLVATVAAACGSSASPSASNKSPTADSASIVQTIHSALGTILVNAKGFTLYHLTADGVDKSVCQGSCAGFWPPLVTKGDPSFSGMSGFTTFNRGGGEMQVAYHGEPLYTFSGDTKPGETSGQAMKNIGGPGHWFVVNFGTAGAAASSTTAPGATSSSGGGY